MLQALLHVFRKHHAERSSTYGQQNRRLELGRSIDEEINTPCWCPCPWTSCLYNMINHTWSEGQNPCWKTRPLFSSKPYCLKEVQRPMPWFYPSLLLFALMQLPLPKPSCAQSNTISMCIGSIAYNCTQQRREYISQLSKQTNDN